jgi:redox-sensitive bicupin YhaK (pirin superfamily)
MTWFPGKDPIPGDAQSVDQIELVVVPRSRDIGPFAVRRALPHGKRQMVGPFIFFDHFGPVQFLAGQGMDVGAHPHIGLSTVTYLFDGIITHRDSEQNVQEIAPGAMNLMTAGRGIAHSERTPEMVRASPHFVLGLQSWIALPISLEESDPSFQHFAADTLPIIEDEGVRARIIAGRAFGEVSPVKTTSDWFYVEVALAPGLSVPLDPDYEDRAVYLVEGEVQIAGERFEAPKLLVFRPGDRISITATQPTRMMLLGGATMEGPRHIWWNFVSSSRERIEQAKEDWKLARFPAVPDESEVIPLPG